MRCTTSSIFWNQFLICVQYLDSFVLLFMQTMPCLIRPGGLKYFVVWILSESPHIIHALRIWSDQTFIYSNISNIIWRKILSFGRGISSRNSHNFEQGLMNHFGGFIQELDGQIGLSRHTQRLLLSLK
jgi:hypothetical protein